MELSVYKRQIALGGVASAAFLVAGIFGAGTAFASTGSVTPSASALIAALPSAHSVPMIVRGEVAPAGHDVVQHLNLQQQAPSLPLAPVSQALPGLGTASGIVSTATGVYNAVPGLQAGPNTVSGLGQDTQLPGLNMSGGSLAKTATSLTPGQLNGTASSIGQAANALPGGTNLPSVGSLANSANTIPGASAVSSQLGSALGGIASGRNMGSLSGATSSLSGVTSLVPGVAGLANGNGLNGSLPIG
jgi:hypothetical protein